VNDAGRAAQWVQRLLAGMPGRRPPLTVHTDPAGRQLVLADRAVVLFGPFEPTDLGGRNLAIVALTQMGFGVGQVAAAFGLRPGTVSALRTAFHREGAAGVVKVSGRPGPLDPAAAAEIRTLRAQGWSQARIAAQYGVTQPAISQALARHPAPTGHADDRQPDGDPRSGRDRLPSASLDLPEAVDHDHLDEPADDEPGADEPGADEPGADAADARDDARALHDAQDGNRAEAAGRDEPGRVGEEGAAFGLGVGGGPRIETGSFGCRYAGAMLGYAYLDRAGVDRIWAGLAGAPWRRFDQGQIATFTVLALLAGVGSVEQVKTLIRTQAGPLIGAPASPTLEGLRGRLAAIADGNDVPALQTQLATAMLAMPGAGGGIFYVDDHFVPYAGAKPVAMGHNGKRNRCEPGRADTLITDARGRAVCFTSAEPSHLSKTMKPALTQLRAIVPDGPILLGFDRGGAYAEAFTACRDQRIDFVTYRRGALAATTAQPVAHHVRRGRKTVTVVLADEQIPFKDYDGPCRQLTLYEPTGDCGCDPAGDPVDCPHLAPVLQVLTSDLTAPAPDLLFVLKGRWVIENVFKYLDFYGIDWLVDYHAEITVHTKLVDNPARKEANAAIRAAKTAHADAERALGALLTGPAGATAAEKNAALPAAQAAVADAAAARIKDLTAARDQVPVKLPANQVNPNAARALLRTHRRGLLMVLRLLAYNADTWLADHLGVYLRDPDEYRALTRALMHHPGMITYTPQAITVTLDRHHSRRINRALALLIDELNASPAHLPGDRRPLTYQIAGS